jgi:hypothetical protein
LLRATAVPYQENAMLKNGNLISSIFPFFLFTFIILKEWEYFLFYYVTVGK